MIWSLGDTEHSSECRAVLRYGWLELDSPHIRSAFDGCALSAPPHLRQIALLSAVFSKLSSTFPRWLERLGQTD